MPRPTRDRFGFISGKVYIAAGVLIAIALIVWLVLWLLLPAVSVTHLGTGPVVQAFYATGTVQPVREFPIKASTAGTLEQVLVDKGDRVKAGQPLARINDPSLIYSAAQAEGMLEEKRLRLDAKNSPVLAEFDEKLRINADRREIASREFQRFEAMIRTNAVSKTDRDQSLDRMKMLDAENEALLKQRAAKLLELQRELSTAQAGRDTAQWYLDQQTLKAPIDGVVLDRPTSQGTRVAVNDSVMRIADVRPANLVMRAQVDEEDVTHCQPGQLVRMSLYAFPGRPITGHVRQVYDEADTSRRTFEVDVAFDESIDRMAAGMTGELAFVESEKASASILPSTALQGGRVCVVRDGRLVDIEPQIGLRSVERIEVVSGIDAKDAVVVSPLGSLKSGQRVRTHMVEPADATPVQTNTMANPAAANLKAF
ncbi:MAG: efflux transporter, family, subunit protein [Phycisphaerales bacterium]|nr:efflux transporter, family, subunit protein [Phycisphaerales bacterium]